MSCLPWTVIVARAMVLLVRKYYSSIRKPIVSAMGQLWLVKQPGFFCHGQFWLVEPPGLSVLDIYSW